ncbi:fibroblast growth factor 9-like [Bacillus rossius redtenbacheri]|uniref:fibroblast growth factor 9-like n=1 Tax=Bacillus rossius redtenbacheri TaxID=93214 RepID=UPI002FDCD673
MMAELRCASVLAVCAVCAVCVVLAGGLVVPDSQLEDDGTPRSERSTNLSHITGTARRIQLYVKNRHLQILPDGTVNGTAEDSSDGVDYTILQRSSVHTGQLKIQSVATCLFLCMDSCGLLYGSSLFTADCVFNEMIEQHHYNTYSSARYSNQRRTLYLALNRRGQPRKVQVRRGATLGKLSAYTRVLTQPVPAPRVQQLEAALLRGRHPARHHQPCPPPPAPPHDARDQTRCRRRKKRKKKRRWCRAGEAAGEQCRRRCAASADQEECVRRRQEARGRRKSKKKARASNRRRRLRRPKQANNGGGKLEQAERGSSPPPPPP